MTIKTVDDIARDHFEVNTVGNILPVETDAQRQFIFRVLERQARAALAANAASLGVK